MSLFLKEDHPLVRLGLGGGIPSLQCGQQAHRFVSAERTPGWCLNRISTVLSNSHWASQASYRYHLTPVRMAIINLQTINAGEGGEKRGPSYTVGGKVNCCSHSGEQYGCLSKSWKQNHTTQQSHSWRIHGENSNSKGHTYPSVHNSTTDNSQDMEAT